MCHVSCAGDVLFFRLKWFGSKIYTGSASVAPEFRVHENFGTVLSPVYFA